MVAEKQRDAASQDADGPSLEERRHILQEWTELHYHPLHQALAQKVLISDPPHDFRSSCADFLLDYRPESNGNPATAYSVNTAGITKTSPGDVGYDELSPMMEQSYKEHSQSPDFVGLIKVRCEWIHCFLLDYA